jgi:recombination protein RecR
LNSIESLTGLFAKLPGLGKKSAGRIAYHILEMERSYAVSLSQALAVLHDSIKRCSICGSWTENDPCLICSSVERDNKEICVVERAQDVHVIEESREFHGRFHVLGGLISPLDGIGPNDLTIGQLVSRVKRDAIREVILALNPTVEGDTTSLYLQSILKDTTAEITRLASGLPVGGDLEYAGRLTLARSFRGRIKM